MNINSQVYPSTYEISDLYSPSEKPIKFSDDIATLSVSGALPLGTKWDNSNCYLGFDPRINNCFVGDSEFVLVDYGTGDEGYGILSTSDLKYERKINYRPMLYGVNSNYQSVYEKPIRWTNTIAPFPDSMPQTPETVTGTNSFTGSQYSYTFPWFTVDSMSCHPITDIDFESIVLDITFLFQRDYFQFTGDVITGYQYSPSVWSAQLSNMKPADKTAQGAWYDSDLWNKGYRDILDNGVWSRDYCYGAIVKAYYGKTPGQRVSLTPLDSTNATLWNVTQGTLPQNHTHFYFAVMSEVYDPVTESIFYKFPNGIAFDENQKPNNGNKDIYGWDDANGTFIDGASVINPNIQSYQNAPYYSIARDDNYQQILTYPRTFPNNQVNVKDDIPYLVDSLTNVYIRYDNGSVIRYEHDIRYYQDKYKVYSTNTVYPIKDLVATIASFGFYFAADSSSAQNDSIENPTTNIYRGNYGDDGVTDGTWSQGDDIDVPPIDDVSYIPDNPDEPEPDSGEESGDRLEPQLRYFKGTSNFITQYAMKSTQVSVFGNLLWTSWVDGLGNLTDMWQNFLLAGQSYLNTGSFNYSEAIKFIVSLKLFPFEIPNTTFDSLVDEIIIGSGMYPITVEDVYKVVSPLIYLDFGTVKVPKPLGDYRDYVNMSISIVLPYCGTAEINPGDVVGRDLRCWYSIDLQSGSCTASVYSRDDTGLLYPVCQLDGQIGASIPLTSTNTGQLASRVISDAVNAAGIIGSGISGKVNTAAKVASGNFDLGDSDLSGAMLINPLFALTDKSLQGALNEIPGALARPAIGSPMLSGGAGLSSFIQPSSPYVQMRYGLYPEVQLYNHTMGKPSAHSEFLSNYIGSGFIKCANVDVSSLTCHGDEKRAIKEALEMGVYL